MLLLTIRARPTPGSADAEEHGGAYVLCWIDFKDPWGAEQVARAYIRDNGWVPEVLTETSEIAEEDITDEDWLQYYREAVESGSCFVYNVWAIGAEDSDVDYDSS